MIRLYEETQKQADQDTPHDRFKIGTMVGLAPIAVTTICVLLARANFIIKDGDNDITITPHGVKLVERLLDI